MARAKEQFLAHVALRLSVAQLQNLQAQLAALDVRVESVSMQRLQQRLAESSFLLVGRAPQLDWSATKQLRLLQVAGTGVDPLLPAEGLSEDVFIAKTRVGQEQAVHDHALALLLAFARKLPQAYEAQRLAEWSRAPIAPISGKRITILGLGEIGTRFAATAQHLGLRVTGVCRRPRSVAGVERVLAQAELADALCNADFLVVCLPLTPETRGLLNAATLELLPNHAVLINVARGAIVDEAALEAALRAGKLGGAALDVFSEEPLLQNSSLWSCPRLLITAHQAGYTPDYVDRVCLSFADNIQQVLSGKRPQHLVSRVHSY